MNVCYLIIIAIIITIIIFLIIAQLLLLLEITYIYTLKRYGEKFIRLFSPLILLNFLFFSVK